MSHTQEEYKGYQIEISYDEDPMNPRTDFDNLGFMACWHRRMWLGDKPKEVQKYEPLEYIRSIVSDYWKDIENSEKYEEWITNQADKTGLDPDDITVDHYIEYMSEKDLWYWFEKNYVWLPVNAYEHGGITISTGRRAGWDSWDSGQLGIIYVSKKRALEEFSQKKWSKNLEDKVVNILEGEVETYDQFLTGDVHGICVTDPSGEEIENVWGFYGRDYAMEEAKSIVDWHIKSIKEKKKEITESPEPVFFGL